MNVLVVGEFVELVSSDHSWARSGRTSKPEFERRGVGLKAVHVRNRDSWEKLESHQARTFASVKLVALFPLLAPTAGLLAEFVGGIPQPPVHRRGARHPGLRLGSLTRNFHHGC